MLPAAKRGGRSWQVPLWAVLDATWLRTRSGSVVRFAQRLPRWPTVYPDWRNWRNWRNNGTWVDWMVQVVAMFAVFK